ncbi:MAG TPA: hypothetical protein VLA87_03855, partial [Gaiellaceae bacterium]|nr:hypothetical protein [Gaiellaceae bacterium]
MKNRWSLGAWVVFAALVAGCAAFPASARAQAPNVLIIVTDDQRATDTLSAMPQTRRSFLAGGTRYSNAFAATPLCC